MTSSFGNLVGTERDEIPNISNTNYTETEPDLTNSVNAQIDANIQDTQVFYERLGEIQKLIAETPMKNLESLAQFSRSATEAMGVYKKKQEAQALADKFNALNDQSKKLEAEKAQVLEQKNLHISMEQKNKKYFFLSILIVEQN